jgi:hypothetical protein
LSEKECHHKAGHCFKRFLLFFCLAGQMVWIISLAGLVSAGEISVLAPAQSDMKMFSRNKIVNVVVSRKGKLQYMILLVVMLKTVFTMSTITCH